MHSGIHRATAVIDQRSGCEYCGIARAEPRDQVELRSSPYRCRGRFSVYGQIAVPAVAPDRQGGFGTFRVETGCETTPHGPDAEFGADKKTYFPPDFAASLRAASTRFR